MNSKQIIKINRKGIDVEFGVTSYSRGHNIYYDGLNWRYCDNNEINDDSRPCPKCGKFPTVEGYDACLGYIEGGLSVCCGHGVHNPIMMKI
jgi:hypothetical protein